MERSLRLHVLATCSLSPGPGTVALKTKDEERIQPALVIEDISFFQLIWNLFKRAFKKCYHDYLIWSLDAFAWSRNVEYFYQGSWWIDTLEAIFLLSLLPELSCGRASSFHYTPFNTFWATFLSSTMEPWNGIRGGWSHGLILITEAEAITNA